MNITWAETNAEPPHLPPTGLRIKAVGRAAHAHIQSLQPHYRDNQSSAVAIVALLRRGVGKRAGSDQHLWGLTGVERLDPEELMDLDMVQVEEALHTATTLWAWHQQAHRNADMHQPRIGLGAAVRALMPDDERGEAIRKRFVRAGSSPTFPVLAERLRELVTLMRREAQPLDYGLLADQLYAWQRPQGQEKVRRAWGRDFHFAGARRARQATESPLQN